MADADDVRRLALALPHVVEIPSARLALVGTERLAELVTDAWRMRAPEELASDLAEAGEPPG